VRKEKREMKRKKRMNEGEGYYMIFLLGVKRKEEMK
jgi:hypothetical protein